MNCLLLETKAVGKNVDDMDLKTYIYNGKYIIETRC